MPRTMSQPEQRFAALAVALNLRDLVPNDGTADALRIDLSGNGFGTSLIRDGRLFSDYPPNSGKGPKNYKQMCPDFRSGPDFVEVKGDISGSGWRALGRDALNDNLRLVLLRMKLGAAPDLRRRYDQLDARERQIVDDCLIHSRRSSRDGRYYLRWSELESQPGPNSNLSECQLAFGARSLPVKVLAGTEKLAQRLFVVDLAIMKRWEQFVG